MFIKLLDKKQEIPFDLLLLADPSRDLVEEYVRRGYCYLAFQENEIVGEFVLIHTHPQTIEIANIAVKEEYQGQGIGSVLVYRAIEEAKKLKAKIVEIGTGNSSMNQLKLYQRCGFRIFGIDPDYFIRNDDEEIYEDGIQCKDMIRLRMDL
ncbi:acetyltransferase [Paenibacillus wynnii]|uniref:Acetyltransferase n=1 Tax=Paenibacillus wynnii TaxID=268407 RepID=A0A098MA65_9BACL|nr:acetyltransferase [Paenibacillus wynnii]